MPFSAVTSSAADQAITGARAERILRAAADCHAKVELRGASGATEMSVSAVFDAIGHGAIIIRVGAVDAVILRKSLGEWDAGFSIDGQPFSFTTTVLREGDDSEATRLASPEQLTLSQRRRTRRYRLARARVVEVRDPSGGDLLCTATLLNLSPDGIAAKTTHSLTDRCRSGQSCRVRFRLDDDGPEFEMPAGITNVTPAGDAGHVVLGMEFLRDGPNEPTREQISEALARLTRQATEGLA